MGKCVIKLDEKYMQWSSISDSPSSLLLPEPLFKKFWESEYGRDGYLDYTLIMNKMKASDCSASGYTASTIIRGNRAGKNEKRLSKAELIAAYSCTEVAKFNGWIEAREKRSRQMAEEFGNRQKVA